MSQLDEQVAKLAAAYLPLAVSILKETIRIPADHVDRPPEEDGDPEYLQAMRGGFTGVVGMLRHGGGPVF